MIAGRSYWMYPLRWIPLDPKGFYDRHKCRITIMNATHYQDWWKLLFQCGMINLSSWIFDRRIWYYNEGRILKQPVLLPNGEDNGDDDVHYFCMNTTRSIDENEKLQCVYSMFMIEEIMIGIPTDDKYGWDWFDIWMIFMLSKNLHRCDDLGYIHGRLRHDLG